MLFISFIRMPWDIRIMDLTLRLPKNEGSTYGTSNRESTLANTESASFIHTYFIWFHSWASKHKLYLGCSLRVSLGSLCIDQEWPSVKHKSISPLDYPILRLGIIYFIMCIIWGWPHSFIGKNNFTRHRSCEHHEI